MNYVMQWWQALLYENIPYGQTSIFNNANWRTNNIRTYRSALQIIWWFEDSTRHHDKTSKTSILQILDKDVLK